MLQNALSLKMESLPQVLKSPFNFTFVMTFLLFIIVGYANNLICSLIGIIYPIIYGLDLFSTNSIDNNKLILLNKYWILFGGLHLSDSLFGFVMKFLPGYFYLKIALVYVLIRNDFTMSEKLFSIFEKFYINSNLYPKIEMLLSFAKAKFNVDQNDVQNNLQSEQILQGNRSDTNKTTESIPNTITIKNTLDNDQSNIATPLDSHNDNEQSDEPSEELETIEH